MTAICNGIIAKRDTIAAYPGELLRYIKKYFSGAKVNTVYEAGFSGFYLRRYLSAQGIITLLSTQDLLRQPLGIGLKQTKGAH